MPYLIVYPESISQKVANIHALQALPTRLASFSTRWRWRWEEDTARWESRVQGKTSDWIFVKVSGVGSAMVATYAFTTPLATRLISR